MLHLLIHILILAHCNTINLQIVSCQRGMGGESWHWFMSLPIMVTPHQCSFEQRRDWVTADTQGCHIKPAEQCEQWCFQWGTMPTLFVWSRWTTSLSPLQLTLQRNDSLSRHHREVYNHSLHCCFLFMHIHAVCQKRIGEGWWGHNLQSILIKYSKAPLAELRLLSKGDQGMTYRCLPCGGTVELLQVCHTCSLIPSALVV